MGRLHGTQVLGSVPDANLARHRAERLRITTVRAEFEEDGDEESEYDFLSDASKGITELRTNLDLDTSIAGPRPDRRSSLIVETPQQRSRSRFVHEGIRQSMGGRTLKTKASKRAALDAAPVLARITLPDRPLPASCTLVLAYHLRFVLCIGSRPRADDGRARIALVRLFL